MPLLAEPISQCGETGRGDAIVVGQQDLERGVVAEAGVGGSGWRQQEGQYQDGNLQSGNSA
jgi:hypothetical protein